MSADKTMLFDFAHLSPSPVEASPPIDNVEDMFRSHLLGKAEVLGEVREGPAAARAARCVKRPLVVSNTSFSAAREPLPDSA